MLESYRRNKEVNMASIKAADKDVRALGLLKGLYWCMGKLLNQAEILHGERQRMIDHEVADTAIYVENFLSFYGSTERKNELAPGLMELLGYLKYSHMDMPNL